MPEFHADSTVLARLYCPGCEPDADPFTEILDVHWCDAHMPTRDGSDDGTVASTIVVSGSAEAGGEGNRRWCDFFHREARPRPEATPRSGRQRAASASRATPPGDGAPVPSRTGWRRDIDPTSPESAPAIDDALPAP